MSSLYDPRMTSQSAGGSLTGTMVQPSPENGFGEEFRRSLAGLSEFQVGLQQQQEQPQPAFRSLKIKSDGSVSIDTDQGTLAEVMAQLTDLKTMKTAAMARVAQLRQQEASGSPILDALSQLAGGLAANDPTMPGWVRALGATSLQMGPQGIAAKRAAEEAKVMRLGQSQAEIAQTLLANERADKQLAMQQQQISATQAERTLSRIEGAVKDITGRYKDEVDKGRPIDPMAIATELAAAQVSPERAIAIANQMAKQSEVNREEIQRTKMEDIRTKEDLERFRADLDARKDMTADARRHAYKMAELQFTRETALEKIRDASAKKTEAQKRLGAPQREALTQINVLDEKLDNLVQRASKFKGSMGPVMGRLGTLAQNMPWVSEGEWAAERKAITSELQRFTAQYVRAVQGGGNTISNKDVENAAKALPNVNMTFDQFVELVKSVKEEGQYQRNAIKAAYEGDWEGKDMPLLGQQGAAKAQQKPSGPRPLGGGWVIEEVP